MIIRMLLRWEYPNYETVVTALLVDIDSVDCCDDSALALDIAHMTLEPVCMGDVFDASISESDLDMYS